jgi:pyruvate kinase
MERRAKVIATLGPASSDDRIVKRLLVAGVDVVRLNLSHGSSEQHLTILNRVRHISEGLGRHVPVLFDLMGPRYRLGRLPEGEMRLRAKQRITLGGSTGKEDLPVDSPHFLDHLKPGERLLIDNGLVELRVEGLEAGEVKARVLTGGRVSSRKGINLPDSDLPFKISAKDRADIRMAVESGVDFLGASYVSSARDLKALRKEIDRSGGNLPLVAKLERQRAVARLEEIVQSSDAVMVARGDLGVEVPLHQVPVLQKKIIDMGCHYGKPVIVATQMLESMMERPRPTRAEASDVANAVFDGADAMMLSGETAAGNYPVQAVKTMVQVIEQAEAYVRSRGVDGDHTAARAGGHTTVGLRTLDPTLGSSREGGLPEIADAVARAAVYTASHLGVRKIVAFSQSGFTARLIARYRPQVPIVVVTPNALIARRTQLLWGVRPLVLEESIADHDVVTLVERQLRHARLVRPGERLIILMGEPIRDRPLTNLMRIHQISA